jgi:cytochrome c-type biogenesis protein CcmE
MKTVNISLLIGIAILAMVGITVLATSGAIGGASKYTTFSEAKKSGEVVHVVGSWAKELPSQYDPVQDVFQFSMRDTTLQLANVLFHDPKPVNFETAEKVVVQGKYVGDVFEAERIFMKCPSKYNDGQLMEESAEAKR